MVLYGNGRNGKSVFLDILNEIFGNYATNIQPQAIMASKTQSDASPEIAKLDGARLVTTTEPNEGERFDEGLIKQLTGGDRVSARKLYENEFEFTPQFKLWMATNHKPYVRGRDDGIWRRFVIIPFEKQIPLEEIDRDLTNKLKRATSNNEMVCRMAFLSGNVSDFLSLPLSKSREMSIELKWIALQRLLKSVAIQIQCRKFSHPNYLTLMIVGQKKIISIS